MAEINDAQRDLTANTKPSALRTILDEIVAADYSHELADWDIQQVQSMKCDSTS